MKLKLLLIFTLLISIGCGKDTEPDQSYIVNDEKSDVLSTSVTDDLNSSGNQVTANAQALSEELLKDVSFEEDSCESNNILRDVLIFGEKIKSLGGNVLDLDEYGADEVEFQKFLTDSGVQSMSAMDIANSGTKSTMKSCNEKNMIPPKSCWYRSLAFSLLKDKIEDETGVNTTLTSHYRSSCYNNKLGGAKKSDHISAKAMDFSMGNQENRHQVEKFICDKLWKENYFMDSETEALSNVSIGLGKTYIHLGLDSTHGRRHWVYNDYAKANNMPATCWNIN
ncbi:D-Ala-D-Ala carboxypeptidase family metallohydrolase [Halobacteriovorax sp.]|uniref:D-Ala-D-Ala carboxypeptidase family metallohydrolase n=1 Tax=Halobacteriovorax sp. TaxID=2020862 RepID=UPI003568C689